jgi:hypothetical protein
MIIPESIKHGLSLISVLVGLCMTGFGWFRIRGAVQSRLSAKWIVIAFVGGMVLYMSGLIFALPWMARL